MTAQPTGPRPTCPQHYVPMAWQTSWGYPSWECGQCMESAVEEPDDDNDAYADYACRGKFDR